MSGLKEGQKGGGMVVEFLGVRDGPLELAEPSFGACEIVSKMPSNALEAAQTVLAFMHGIR